LKGKSARVIVTMGMPGFVYKWYFGAHALKMFKRNILKFVGIGPIRSSIFGNVEGVSAAKRQGWLKQMEERGKNAA
jgi:putative NADPH-quinone reductase